MHNNKRIPKILKYNNCATSFTQILTNRLDSLLNSVGLHVGIADHIKSDKILRGLFQILARKLKAHKSSPFQSIPSH